jgi:hypothetical protein
MFFMIFEFWAILCEGFPSDRFPSDRFANANANELLVSPIGEALEDDRPSYL